MAGMYAQNNATDIGRAALGDQTTDAPADTTGKLIDEKSADELNHKFDQIIQNHRWMMALTAQVEKAGKASLRSTPPVLMFRTAVHLFPSVQGRIDLLCLRSYATADETNQTRSNVGKRAGSRLVCSS